MKKNVWGPSTYLYVRPVVSARGREILIGLEYPGARFHAVHERRDGVILTWPWAAL